MQDVFIRRLGPRAVYDVMLRRAVKIGKDRWILRAASLTDLSYWVADELRRTNPGESWTARGPIPRGTLCYWIQQCIAWHLITQWDEAQNTAGKRFRGDGRHKTTWVIHSFDYTLQQIADDPNVATPRGRTFWICNGKLVTTEQAVAWKLDAAVAERIPEAWESNARRWNPDAPMKPTGKEKPRPATAAEIEALLTELCGNWKIAISDRQAEGIFSDARAAHPDISAEALVQGISEELWKHTAIQRKKNPHGRMPEFTAGWLSAERIRGIANRWHAAQLLRIAEEARNARIASEHLARSATLAEPPPGDD
jgi:hypothetical protein